MTIVWGEGPSGRSAKIVSDAVSELDVLIEDVKQPEVALKLREINDNLKILKNHYKNMKEDRS